MSKIRPYTEKDMKAVHLCAVRNKKTKVVGTITGWDDEYVYVSNQEESLGWATYLQLLRLYTFLDGSICGIKDTRK